MLAATLLIRLVVGDLGPVEIIPVLAAAYWFGSRPAVVAGGIASAMLVAVAILGSSVEPTTLIGSVPLLLVIGYLVGQLVEDRERGRKELAQLRTIQDALAPVKAPALPLIELATRYVPAERGVAGDFYLVTEGHNNSTIVVIGDAVGKGITAARRATFVRATLTACAPYTDDPVHLLRMANAELIRQHGLTSDFITMLCLVVRPDGSLSWSSAGHPPPVSLHDGLPIGAEVAAFPLGIAPDLPAVAQEGVLPEAGILLYTDGLIDARPPGRSYEPFGSARLARLISELRDPTPEDAVTALVRVAETFSKGSLPDDLCLVALRSKLPRYWGAPTNGRELEHATTTAEVIESGVAPRPRRLSKTSRARRR